jgi:hypothetical protein
VKKEEHLQLNWLVQTVHTAEFLHCNTDDPVRTVSSVCILNTQLCTFGTNISVRLVFECLFVHTLHGKWSGHTWTVLDVCMDWEAAYITHRQEG